MATTRTRSVRLWASYIVDWIVLVIFALIAYGFTFVHPHPHNFSLVDLTISYPRNKDTVPYWLVGLLVGPVTAIIIIFVCLVFVPGRAFSRGKPSSIVRRLKLWELHVGLLGLAMSLATAVMLTQGLKLFGKPRPNCLARCKPDVSRVKDFYTGHYGGDDTLAPTWALVDIGICTETDEDVLYDGFQSWPSGHSSTSWAGMLYLSLYLCAKFAVTLPYLQTRGNPYRRNSDHPAGHNRSSFDSQAVYKRSDQQSSTAGFPIRHRDEAAAPPVYMLLFIIVPIGVAVYIALSRWMDYAHHGFDIISGSVLGAVCAYVSFRWYHLPVGRGSGWSWGPRSQDRAFAVGVGESGYVDEEEFEGVNGAVNVQNGGVRQDEVELGLMAPGRSSVQQETYDPARVDGQPAGYGSVRQ